MIKVLHVLQMSMPNLSGYSIRSKYIVENQKNNSIEPIVITSPFQKGVGDNKKEDVINGIKYIRSKNQSKSKNKFLARAQYLLMFNFIKDIKEASLKYKPDIIHAHSSFFCGIPSVIAGKKVSIPVIYEVRGIWEDSAVANGKLKYESVPYKTIRSLETWAMKKANLVIVISNNLKEELIKRGISSNKIEVVYNGVDTNKFRPIEKDENLISKYDLKEKIVFGYIGSIIKLEGLEYLIKAFKKIKYSVDNARLIIVGDGSELNNLKSLSKQLNLEEYVVFTGRVNHDEVLNYYSIIDIFVLPRVKGRVSNIVTPLKPFEIMALGKIVVGSDVGGIKEIIENNTTGIIFEAENVDSLANCCIDLANNKEKVQRIANEGNKWVLENRTWEVNVQKYNYIYDDLLNQR